MITTLVRYRGEIEGMLSRFQKTRDSINIDQQDDACFRELVLELRNLFDDEFLDGRRHSGPLLTYFSGSIANWIGSPSYHGVENVKGVVDRTCSAQSTSAQEDRIGGQGPRRKGPGRYSDAR